MSKPTRSDHPCFIRDAPISGDSYPVADTSWCFDRWAKKVAKLPDDSPESAWPPIDWVLFREGALEVAHTPFDWMKLPLTPSDLGRGPGSWYRGHYGLNASLFASANSR